MDAGKKTSRLWGDNETVGVREVSIGQGETLEGFSKMDYAPFPAIA